MSDSSPISDQTFLAFGVRFRVLAPANLWQLLKSHLPPGTRISSAQLAQREYSLDEADGIYRLKVGGEVLRESENLTHVGEAFESELQIHVAEYSPRRVFVHAGVVGWNHSALIFPGRSFQEKSTLVAALIQADAIYYSDEYAVFDGAGRVHPYPRDLSLRQKIGVTRKVSARELNANTERKPIAVGAIFVCRFEENAMWNPRKLSPGEAFLALLDNTVAARSRTREAMHVLEKVAAAAEAYQSARGEAETIISKILK